MKTRLVLRFARLLLVAGTLVGLMTACGNGGGPASEVDTSDVVLRIVAGQPVAAADVVASYDPNGLSFAGVVTLSDQMLAVPNDDGHGRVTVGVITSADVEGPLLELVFRRHSGTATARVDSITSYDATGRASAGADPEVTSAAAPSRELHDALRAAEVLQTQYEVGTGSER